MTKGVLRAKLPASVIDKNHLNAPLDYDRFRR